ncbi:DUF309 domain-containing protein [Nitratifractor sp.]
MKTLAKALEVYRTLLEEGAYYEAHEVLELAWHPLRKADDPRRHLAKGLINAAIAFEHLRRARPKSRRVALQAMEAYDRRKGGYRPSLDTDGRFAHCIETVERIRIGWEI